LDHSGYLPAFVSITDGKTHETKVANSINLTFLTSSLVSYGNAGQQIEDDFEAYFTSLNALIGGVGTWTLTNILAGTTSYSLLGGIITDPLFCGNPGDTCWV